MTERATELSSLKQEVAELWSRFRKDEQSSGSDEERRALSEQVRALEVKQRVLADRRAVLREVVEVERRRLSRFVPVLQGLGMLGGLIGGALALSAFVPEVADWSLVLAPGHGAVLVGLSTLSLPLLLSRR
jgi:hypothetical protein